LAAAVVGGRIYTIGGRIDGSYGRNLAVNEVYDPATDSWRSRTPMPTTRSGIAAAVLDGIIFVFGGESTSGTFDEVEGYDPRTNGWTRYAPMPTARHGLGAAVVSRRVHVISGGPTPGGSASALNEIFRR
jgi:N-acetylneuraminic acid mutarotase